MSKILFIVRGYFPDQSASGNLLFPLIEEMKKEHKVDILTLSNSEIESDENIYRLKIKSITSIGMRLLDYIQRQTNVFYYKSNIKKLIKNEIEKLDSENNYDFYIAVTYEEILALLESKVDKNKKCLFLLEKLPESSYIPFFRRKQKKFNLTFLANLNFYTDKIFSLPIVYETLSRLNLKGVYLLEHPMVRDLTNPQIDKNHIKYNILYAGGLDKIQRNPYKVIKFFKKISKVDSSIHCDFYSYGNLQKNLKKMNNNMFSFNDAISSNELQQKYLSSNLLITIGNKENDIFPSKLFDCLSMGIPILHFAQNKADPYFDYLNDYKYALIILYDDLECDESIQKFISFKKLMESEIKNLEFSMIKDKFYICTPEYNAKIIKDVLSYYD
ncbi:TPA: hypothetical protein ACX6SP_002853 [Photobacterium damselae]